MSPYPTIPGFEFTALIGRGGMATIYSARQLGLNRDVAIKVVEVSGSDAAQYMQRLENEAQSLAQLRHPGIVGLYQSGRTVEGAMYYVMPLLDGGDLSQQRRPMAEDDVVALLDRLLDALEHAHRAGIVHRDIKPENILFDGDKRPLLADFGAAQRPSLSRLTEAGMAIGSAGYMSPEQARGQVVDARSDLYSVGVLAYELLTERLPFEGPDALSIALAQVEQKPAPLPMGRQQWQRFFDRALALDPKQRFATAAEMRAALGEMHTRQAPRRPSLRPPSRVPWIKLASLTLALLLVGAGLYQWWRGGETRLLEQIAQLIEQGQLDQPHNPNAIAMLDTLAGREDEAVQRLRDRLIEAHWAALEQPLTRGDWVALAPLLRSWQRAVQALDADQRGLVVAQRETLATHLQPPLEQALRRFDRAAAEPLLILIEDLRPLPVALSALVDQVQQLPATGGVFRDRDGPALVLLRPPGVDIAGLAIMNAALSNELYQRYAVNSGKSVRECSDAPATVRGCLSLGEADELADWLSIQTGQRYRLPSLDELRSNAAQVATSDALAWTDTCQEVTQTTRPNAAKRAWGGIRKVFGGQGAQPTVRRRCQGNWLVRLDGSTQVSASSDPAPSTTAVFIREIPPLAR